jgi:hypothetical protein
MTAFILPAVEFSFGNGQSGPDKLRGLVTHGPFRRLNNERPLFGFVFPQESNDSANKLFLALKNGIGLFRGVENTFRFTLSRDQVFPIAVSGVEVSPNADHSKNARAYADAVLAWNASQTKARPDMFFVLHPKTSGSEPVTPYYECKAILLKEGILSQNVTLDLINNASQFQWSAANIGLGAFVKLAGIPWVVKGEELDQDLIVGIGRAYLYDPQSRQTTGYMAFTACFSARGPLKFISLAEVAKTRNDYLVALQNIVKATLARADDLGKPVTSLTVHVPKEMQRTEMEVIRTAARSHKPNSFLQPLVIKVTEEFSFFAVDDKYPDGVPRRGTAVQVSDRDYMLYTEGREEKEPWTVRLPVALRVTPQGETLTRPRMLGALRQINDLSQVNWRGLNARSKPISIYYGSLIARLLSHLSPEHVTDLYRADARRVLQERMWFL